MALKDNLKSKRTEKGLTLDEVATKVGVSRQTIQRYESGVISNIPSDNIEKLASALDTTPAELMGWGGGAVKVTTRMTFDDNSPMHALTQAYLRRPSLVQDEIIRRLEGLDATFSNKVSKLLQASGDINGFMQGTSLPFATVGKFMQGETVLTTPAEAERIATYFHTNVVDLFFNDSEAQTKKTPAQKALPSSSKSEDLGPNAKRLSLFINNLVEESLFLSDEGKERIRNTLKDSRLENLMKNVFDEIDDGNLTQSDFDVFYAIIAKKIFNHPENFRIKYLDSEISEHLLKDLLSKEKAL